jgi:predicted dithiol-disulfide oxidoreductase (DUF899 family)
MPANDTLTPASDLVKRNGARFPGESTEYRKARDALLAEEIELRRHIERVAQMRRALPPGHEVTKRYEFEGEEGKVGLADLFHGKQSLVVYSFMFGPQRKRPCPMCTNLLGAWEGNANDVDQQASLVVIARSPLERLVAFRKERGWRNLRLYSDLTGEYSKDYKAISPEGDDWAGINVFTRRDGKVRHFWSGEMGGETADPGQDPRGAPDAAPLWMILDLTPEGRPKDWYPKLDYGA